MVYSFASVRGVVFLHVYRVRARQSIFAVSRKKFPAAILFGVATAKLNGICGISGEAREIYDGRGQLDVFLPPLVICNVIYILNPLIRSGLNVTLRFHQSKCFLLYYNYLMSVSNLCIFLLKLENNSKFGAR